MSTIKRARVVSVIEFQAKPVWKTADMTKRTRVITPRSSAAVVHIMFYPFSSGLAQ